MFWGLVNVVVKSELFRRYLRQNYDLTMKESFGLTYTYRIFHIDKIIQTHNLKAVNVKQ